MNKFRIYDVSYVSLGFMDNNNNPPQCIICSKDHFMMKLKMLNSLLKNIWFKS